VEYKYIYFANPLDDKHLERTVCVKECPVSENEMETDGLQF
jgi:solute carrier family 44 protein 1 (choline transporter-like protein)